MRICEGLGPLSKFPCRLYLSAPGGHPCDVLTTMLGDALAGNDVAAVLYAPDNNANSDECARTLMQCAVDHEAAFIVENDITLARKIGADGVHITSGIDTYKTARSELGDECIIGLTTALNRHDSMCIGETGASYIFFDPDISSSNTPNNDQTLPSLIGWWSELFEIPCVAPAYADVDQNRQMITAGVDFLSLGHSVWSSKDGASQTIKALNQLITECGRER